MSADDPISPEPVDPLAVLGGIEGVAVGLSFVPIDAIDQMRWGGVAAPARLAAVCRDLRPDFVFVPAWEPWADEAADRLISCGTDVFWVVPGPFGLVAERDGWAQTLRLTAVDPSEIRARTRLLMPGLFESVRRGVAMGARAIVVAEDMAGSEGMLFSPDFAMEILMPLLASMADTAVEEGVLSILHSDGDIRALHRSIRQAGYAGLHVGALSQEEFQKVFESARHEGLGVLGGVDPASLRSGTPSAMAAGAQAGVLAQGGGLLICDDGGITTSAELAALVVALQAARGS